MFEKQKRKKKNGKKTVDLKERDGKSEQRTNRYDFLLRDYSQKSKAGSYIVVFFFSFLIFLLLFEKELHASVAYEMQAKHYAKS